MAKEAAAMVSISIVLKASIDSGACITAMQLGA